MSAQTKVVHLRPIRTGPATTGPAPAAREVVISPDILKILPDAAAPPANLPVQDSHLFRIMEDRSDPNLRWYEPVFQLMDDPDARFTFNASQEGVDKDGNPFNKVRISLALTKVVPDNVLLFQLDNPGISIREIPLANLTAALSVTFKDSETGEDRTTSYLGSIAAVDDAVVLTFDHIIGPGAIIAYENLMQNAGASVILSATYQVWSVPPPLPVFFPQLQLPGTTELITTATQPSAGPAAAEQTARFQAAVPLGAKYAANQYALEFTLTRGDTTRPILGISDLKEFELKQSEFTELKVLGDISQRFPSLSRLYLGVLSKTIVAIPARYAIMRNVGGLVAACDALLDSASAGASKAKFAFNFVLAPDASSIDLLQLSQEIAARPELHGCTLMLPKFLKEGTGPKLLTPFQSSCQCSAGPAPHTFALAIEIQDRDNDTPAVANANLLIRELGAEREPFVSGTLALKLDDFYPDPVEASVVLNFRQTSSTDELRFVVNEQAGSVSILNQSPLDIALTRIAFCTAGQTTVLPVSAAIASGSSFDAALPPGHEGLSVLSDSDISIQGPIRPGDLRKYLTLRTQDVQNIQFAVGVNASDVKFLSRGISTIDVAITFTELPNTSVPQFTLLEARKVEGTTFLIPIQQAITALHGTLLFTVHPTDPQQPNLQFTLENDFIDRPIFLLSNSAIDRTA